MHKVSILNTNGSVLVSVEGPTGLSQFSAMKQYEVLKKTNLILCILFSRRQHSVDSVLVSGNERSTHDL